MKTFMPLLHENARNIAYVRWTTLISETNCGHNLVQRNVEATSNLHHVRDRPVADTHFRHFSRNGSDV